MKQQTGKTREAQELSPFALVLKRLLDETTYFQSRAEWARFLGVSTSALSQWVNDKTLPRASLLRTIVDALRSARGVPTAILEEFDELARRPSDEISPFGARMGKTLRDYLETSTFAGLGRTLSDMSPEEQSIALAEGSWKHDTRKHVTSESQFEHCDVPSVRAPVDMFLVPDLQPATPEASPRIDLRGLLSKQRVVVVGAAGSGKSSMLQALALLFEDERVVPVLLHWGMRYGPTRVRDPLVVPRGSAGSRTALLIDGLDEVPEEHRLEAVEEILAVAADAPALPMIVTSRPIPELERFKAFEHLNVAPLREVQVVQRVAKALASVGISQGASSSELDRFVCHMTERPSLRHWLRNPLFLESACSLFVRNGVTPFAEAELVGEFVWRLLDDWDRDKHVIRVREPWASPRTLWATLAELCFHLVSSKTDEFATSDAANLMKGRLGRVPYDRLLSLLSVQSGLLQASSDNRWRVMAEYLRNFLAATYVVESSDDAFPYLRAAEGHGDLDDVYRLACGITSDATPLLRGVLEASDTSPAERSVLLAETLAQPFAAEGRIVAQTCKATVSWLDTSLVGWNVYRHPKALQRLGEEETLWNLHASCSGHRKTDQNVLRVLGAIHQARSGPARDPFRESLRKAESPVLVAFGESIGVEGRLRLKVDNSEEATTLFASVVAPQLA